MSTPQPERPPGLLDQLRTPLGALIGAAIAVLLVLGQWVATNTDPEEPPDPTPPSTGTTSTTPTSEPPSTGTTQPPTTADGPMTVPAACRPAATNSGAQLRQDWPTDESTGPSGLGLDEDRLPKSGKPATWTITEPGTVVEGVFHRGRIVVKAADVKITGSVVCGTGAQIVEVGTGGAGLVIEDSIIAGEKGTVMANAGAGQPCEAAVGYGGFTLRRTEVKGCVDGVKVAGRTHITDSYFHDNYANRGGENGTHNDTVQYQSTTQALSDFVFRRNAAYQDGCTSNRHFQMAPSPSGGSGGTWRIEDNFFSGVRLINIDRGTRVADGQMNDNVYAARRVDGALVGTSPTPFYAGTGIGTVKRSGNTFEDGTPADGEPPAGYTCRRDDV